MMHKGQPLAIPGCDTDTQNAYRSAEATDKIPLPRKREVYAIFDKSLIIVFLLKRQRLEAKV